MKEYILSYYPNFKCIANNCKHTCCAGWDMYIDKKTLNDYKNEKSTFSTTLQKGIDFKKSKFMSDKFKRCAFLNGDGLCEIIKNLGENSLCQICRDHPRFRSFFEIGEEIGLGFCCEEATRIILSYKEKIVPILAKCDSDNAKLSFIQEQVLRFRTQIIDAIQDRSLPISARIDNILNLCKAKVSENDFSKILKKFTTFEKLDKTWGSRLKAVKRNNTPLDKGEDLSIYCEQFLVNSFYRHVAQAEDTIWARAIALACVFSWWIIRHVYQNEKSNETALETLCDIVRDFSSEVEYSQKNVQNLFSFACKFVVI